jgi:predicted DCC family thiol-disulfide oxidoreductase YuxK
MIDEYIEKLAAVAYQLSEASKELLGAIEWYAADMKSLHFDSEERGWKALDVALEIIKHDKPDAWKKLTTVTSSTTIGDKEK